jgi:hypothetical protein
LTAQSRILSNEFRVKLTLQINARKPLAAAVA